MGKTTISWTDYSWNPWRGCHKVSQGCKNCYMFREQKRYGNDPNVVIRSKTTFKDPLKWKDPAMVFTCSWSDFFIEEADEWRDEAWEIIRRTPHLTYQILTKRPENILSRLPDDWGDGWANVWLGVSAEDQENANRRIPLLIQIPATIHFVSCEPLLGSIDLNSTMGQMEASRFWTIVGGESGPNFRSLKIEWVRDIFEQCQEHAMPLFVKQDSGPKPGMRGRIPEDLWIQQFPVIQSQ